MGTLVDKWGLVLGVTALPEPQEISASTNVYRKGAASPLAGSHLDRHTRGGGQPPQI